MKTFVIFKFNPDHDVRPDSYVPVYSKVDVRNARTAKEALLAFAQENGLTVTGGPASGGYWIKGRKSLSSFGQGQYHADVTTLPANIEAAAARS